MEEFLFESIRGKKLNIIKDGVILHESEKKGLGNYASLHLNKQGGFFIYLLIEALNEKHIEQFATLHPKFKILTKGDKSYMLVNFSPNLPIFEFLFDISTYKQALCKKDLEKILANNFLIALVNSEDEIKSVKNIEVNDCIYKKFTDGILDAFDNPNFSREYRVFLLPFYEKSTDRWWNILEEV